MNTFPKAFEDFKWSTLQLLQSSWENANINVNINQFFKIEKTIKEALMNFKTAVEIYHRTPRKTELYEVSLTDVSGEIQFLPYQAEIIQQMMLDAKILIKDIEDKTTEGLSDEALEAFIRGSIGAWKEHSGMVVLNQMIEKRGNPLELFP